MQHPQPFHEPFRITLLRNLILALIIGTLLAFASHNLRQLPLATLLALWPTFGGHFIELLFLNYLRPRLSPSRPLQIAARLLTWFIAGILLSAAMTLTARTLIGTSPPRWLPWWLAGLAFITIELLAHLFLQLRRHPNFYNGRA